MIQYIQKFQDAADFTEIDCLEIALRFAPLLLNSDALDSIGRILKSKRRVNKSSTRDYAALLTRSRLAMDTVYDILRELEEFGCVNESSLIARISGSPTLVRALLSEMVNLGLLQPVTDQNRSGLQLTTDFERPARGKCPGCGARVNARKASLLVDLMCPKCGNAVSFALTEPNIV
jgi:predicted transcriptional regulator